ncbi:MAG TPA: hypothetical protein QF624_05710 [Dehalococcoidia bacterium]|nr:hypothetical protein [Dehalococcoidia bacterium]
MSQDSTGLWHWSADFSRPPDLTEGEWGEPVALELATTRGQAIQNVDLSGGTLVHFGSQEDGGGDEPLADTQTPDDVDDGAGDGAGGGGDGEEISDDRGRGINGATSRLDEIVLELYPDDPDRQELVAAGTIGDLFRDLRGKDQVKEVTDALKAAVKGEALIDRTVDLESDEDVTTEVDKATGKDRRVVIVSSASNEVTVRVPVQAIEKSGQFVAVDVEPIEDLTTFSASIPLPSTTVDTTDDSGTPIVTAIDVELTDENGTPLTAFDEDLTITLQVDPATKNLDSLVVASFNDRSASWTPIAATVSSNGVVEFSVNHLTLFALLRMVEVTHTLSAGLNSVTFTGPSGTLPGAVAAQIGNSLENLLTFDVPTQSFLSYAPGASATFNTLEALSQREALFVRVTRGPVAWTETDIIPSATGSRTVAVVQGLNAVGFTGRDGTDVAEIASLDAGIESVSRFETATQRWLTYVPGAPTFANSLTSIGRLDVIFVRYSGPAGLIELPEVGGE